MLISIEGIDGAGKTTVTQYLADLLVSSGLPTEALLKREVACRFQRVSPYLKAIDGALRPPNSADREQYYQQMPTVFGLLLQAAKFSLIDTMLVRPLLQEHRTVIVDGWHFKILARYLLKGLEREFCDRLFGGLSVPDPVFMIDVDPAEAYNRRAHSFVEEGGCDGYQNLGRSSFWAYQSQVREKLLSFADQYGWVVVGTATPRELGNRMLGIIMSERGTQAAR
jgi:thymidylate kinase